LWDAMRGHVWAYAGPKYGDMVVPAYESWAWLLGMFNCIVCWLQLVLIISARSVPPQPSLRAQWRSIFSSLLPRPNVARTNSLEMCAFFVGAVALLLLLTALSMPYVGWLHVNHDKPKPRQFGPLGFTHKKLHIPWTISRCGNKKWDDGEFGCMGVLCYVALSMTALLQLIALVQTWLVVISRATQRGRRYLSILFGVIGVLLLSAGLVAWPAAAGFEHPGRRIIPLYGWFFAAAAVLLMCLHAAMSALAVFWLVPQRGQLAMADERTDLLRQQ